MSDIFPVLYGKEAWWMLLIIIVVTSALIILLIDPLKNKFYRGYTRPDENPWDEMLGNKPPEKKKRKKKK